MKKIAVTLLTSATLFSGAVAFAQTNGTMMPPPAPGEGSPTVLMQGQPNPGMIRSMEVRRDVMEKRMEKREDMMDTREEKMETMMDKKENRLETMKTKFEDRKEKIGERMDDRKIEMEKKMEELKKKFDEKTLEFRQKFQEQYAKRAIQALTQVQNLVTRFEANIAKAKANGIDTTSAEAELANTKTLIATAQTKFEALKALYPTDATEMTDAQRTAVLAAKKEAEDAIKAVHASLKKVLEIIKTYKPVTSSVGAQQ